MADKDLYADDAAPVTDAPVEPAPPPAVAATPAAEAPPASGGGSTESLVAALAERDTRAAPRKGLLNFTIGTPRIPETLMIAFLRQLVMKLHAGVTLMRAITTLAERTPDHTFRGIILDVGRRVEGGSTLWQAFGSHPKHFDHLFVNLVKAGETAGTLTEVLTRVAEHRQKRDLLRRQVRSAMIYPTVILMITVGVLVLFLTIVLPSFEKIFSSFEMDLPAITRGALWLSHSLIAYWFLYLGVIAASIFAVRMVIASPPGRFAWDRFKMRAPMFGDIVTKATVAEFTRTFATLLGSGVSILETLELTRDAVGNVAFAADVQGMRDSIERGEGLEPPLRRSHLMPAIVTDMLVTGEETGALERISHQVADVYEAEVEAAVLQLKNLIEPIMILFLGIVVGGLMLSFFVPYVKLISNVMEGDF